MTDVTVPMDSSDGASAVLAIRSHAIQNILPHMVTAGIITIGLAVPKRSLVICGTAIPTNAIGPANAVTHADSILASVISIILNIFILIPMLFA